MRACDFLCASVAAAIGAGTILALIDAVLRPSWGFSWWDHWGGASVLFLALAAPAGTIWATLHGLECVITRKSASQRFRRTVGAFLRAVVVAAVFWDTAEWTFSGRAISETPWATYGPPLLATVVGMLTFWGARYTGRALYQAARQRRRAAAWAAVVLLGLASSAMFVDLTVYVSLYDRLHTVLEVIAWAGLMAAFAIGGTVLLRRYPRFWYAVRGASVVAFAAATAYGGFQPVRERVDTLLAHGWVDPVYVGRHLRRVQLAELGEDGDSNLEMLRVGTVKERFNLQKTELDPEWYEPHVPYEGPGHEVRSGIENIAVFYVDSLRADVARDPHLMPNLARFRLQALDFANAYAPGSDTLRSLPALTNGNYFVQSTHPGDLVRLATESPARSAVIIPKSARRFLEKLLPEFEFSETVEVADCAPGEKVWGYGADRPTAARIVERAGGVLRQQRDGEPFFLWMFHFDQHAWRELDDRFIEERKHRWGLEEEEQDEDEDEGNWHPRYKVVAKSIDHQFGRFLELLKETGHADDTAVLFVSDHGEALGQNGYWVHSIFLWESLVRVPLVLKIPGLPGRKVETPVSLVDVAPTLAPILGGGPAIYHGEDLLRLASTEAEASFERSLPMLLRGAAKNRLARMGVLEPRTGQKLVFRIEAAFPELYDTRTDPNEQNNLASDRPELVRRLLKTAATSPVFPRAPRDFALLKRRGELGSVLVSQAASASSQ